MTFREALDKHLQAIQHRDLAALTDTLPAGDIVLITADGRLVRDPHEFRDLHEGWFDSRSWTLDVRPVDLRETPDLGVAVLQLRYRDTSPDGRTIDETSYLTLIFARDGGRWFMVHDQNTPVRARPPAE